MSPTTSSPSPAASHRSLHVVDYVFFSLTLLGTLAIGVYHAIAAARAARDRPTTTADYLVGGRRLGVLPVSVSLMASFVSAILMLGFPAEVYVSGGIYWVYCGGIGLAGLLAMFVYVPVFHPLKLTSVNQYLWMRYKSRFMVVLGCISSVSVQTLYTGTVYFAPATAIEAVSGFPTWALIFIGSGLTVIYTTVGGFKAVVWTDVFQAVIMFLGLVAVTVRGAMKVGGMSEVWYQNGQWNRLNFVNWDPDPTVRYTLWSMTIGIGFNFLIIYGTTQTAVQRYSSLPTLTKARLSVLGVVPGTAIMISLACISGLVIFSFYAFIGCDPLKGGFIDNSNQLVPHFIMDTLNMPGLPGIFMAALCAASLSSASSALNAAAANVWDDIFKELWPNVSDQTNLLVTKILVVIFGVASTGLAFAVSLLGGTVIQSITTFTSAAMGPTSALFFMGLAFPFVNWKGACSGGIISFTLVLWVAFGSYSLVQQEVTLDAPTYNCSSYVAHYLPHLLISGQAYNTTPWATIPLTEYSTTAYSTSDLVTRGNNTLSLPSGLYKLYSLSYLWLGLFGFTLAVIIGVPVSLITGGMGDEELEDALLHPWVRRCTRGAVEETREDQEQKAPEQNGPQNSVKEDTEERGLDNPAFEADGISPYYPTMFESSV